MQTLNTPTNTSWDASLQQRKWDRLEITNTFWRWPINMISYEEMKAQTNSLKIQVLCSLFSSSISLYLKSCKALKTPSVSWEKRLNASFVLLLFLFIRPKFKVMFAPFYKTQSIMFFALIIFRLERPLIKRRKNVLTNHYKREKY